jgi:hypothetical protein
VGFRCIESFKRNGRKAQSGMSASLRFRVPSDPALRARFVALGAYEKMGWMFWNRKDLVLSLHKHGKMPWNWNFRKEKNR